MGCTGAVGTPNLAAAGVRGAKAAGPVPDPHDASSQGGWRRLASPKWALTSISSLDFKSLPTPGCFALTWERGEVHPVLPFGVPLWQRLGNKRLGSKPGQAGLGNPRETDLWRLQQPVSPAHAAEEGRWDAGSLFPGTGPAADHPPGLPYCSLGNRTGLMRNPRAGEFQEKGKNSTCLVTLGRAEWGRAQREHKGAPLILGSTHLLLCTTSKAACSQRDVHQPRSVRT